MPANLTPQYLAAEQRFKEAVTPVEKMEALEEMMAIIPKHKGTEKLRAELRKKQARLRNETGKKHGVNKASAMYSVSREGAGQVAVVGAPNTGKSSLLAGLTNATPEIGDYAFTTRLPQPGMMPYENINIQLVDLPPIDPNFYEPWMGGIVRQADLVLLIADLSSDDLLDGVESVLSILGNSRIRLCGLRAPEVEENPGEFRPAFIVANKCDAAGAATNLEILREFYESRFTILPASTVSGEGLVRMKRMVFEELDVIRIYTKLPGKKADLSSPPFVMKRGSTVLDAAKAVHREFVHSLKFAKLWTSKKSGGSVKYEGQMVERTHQLEDGDILELHA